MGDNSIRNVQSCDQPPRGNISCIVDPVNSVGGIYLSDIQAATNLDLLQDHGIRAVVTAAINADIPHYKFVPGYDSEQFQLHQYFHEVSDFIDFHGKQTNILVHCMAGVSRSVALVIAYLMKHKNMKYEDAYTLIKGRRKIIRPNKGFVNQLKKWRKGSKDQSHKLSVTSMLLTIQEMSKERESQDKDTPMVIPKTLDLPCQSNLELTQQRVSISSQIMKIMPSLMTGYKKLVQTSQDRD